MQLHARKRIHSYEQRDIQAHTHTQTGVYAHDGIDPEHICIYMQAYIQIHTPGHIYSYTRVAFGTYVAWIIGWSLIAEVIYIYIYTYIAEVMYIYTYTCVCVC
jgi:hypothetical protein